MSTVAGDVASLADLDRLYQTVAAEKDRVDIVVASAGFVEHAPIDSATPEHFDRTFNINARGTFFTVQKALPLMKKGGSIVLVASVLHLKGLPATRHLFGHKGGDTLLRPYVGRRTQGSRHSREYLESGRD